MEWTRAELKMQGNKALQKNYWKSCFVTTLMMVLSVGTIFSAVADFISEMPTAIKDIYDALMDSKNTINIQLIAVVVTLSFGLLLLSTIFKITVNVLVKNPVEVGARLFMKRTHQEGDCGLVADLAYAFDHGYIKHVKVMLLTHLTILMWSLLLVVPGIIKSYEYRMVAYLLSDQPDLTAREAMRISSEMMKGQKWKTFLLDLSFWPWHLVGLLSLGILEVFYVKPYEDLTRAALYKALK